jgi:L-iditol 2-dehydrogenase
LLAPKTAKAAALVGSGQPLEFMDVEIPQRLEPGAILVKTTMATICGSDTHIIDGDVGGIVGATFPCIPGHEMTGRVVRMGAGVTHDSVGQSLSPGDRIVWTQGFCGQCHYCVVAGDPTLCENRRLYTSTRCTDYPYLVGGFAEYCYVFPTSGRVRVPDAVPDALASASACALRTVIHGFDRLGPVDDRHSVVIQGAGPLGLFALAYALCSSASKVIVVGGPAARLEVAERWGAARCINVDEISDPDERLAEILSVTDGRGPDVVIDVAGGRTAFTEGFRMARRGGRFLVIGTVHNDNVPIRPSEFVLRQLHVMGSFSGDVRHYYRALRFLEDNVSRFSWGDMISNVYPFEQINIAIDRMRDFSEIKAAISFEH